MTSEAGLFTVHHILLMYWDSSHCAVESSNNLYIALRHNKCSGRFNKFVVFDGM